jgi:hypothetical protein
MVPQGSHRPKCFDVGSQRVAAHRILGYGSPTSCLDRLSSDNRAPTAMLRRTLPVATVPFMHHVSVA